MLATAPSATLGHASPRIAPPVPARSDLGGYQRTAADVGINLMPWQSTAAQYLTALGPDDRWLWREVGIVVARQNGKTTLLVPLIVQRLRAGMKIMHTAQDRALPREVFGLVADIFAAEPDLFPERNGRATKPRFANGQEEIKLTNGGVYSIVAPTRGGARGPSRDVVIIDELREMDSWDFIAASKPTLTASRNPQMIYLSNAGEDNSVVLNALRKRADTDPSLAYLEWSTEPDRQPDDEIGWAQSNPAMGHEVGDMGSIRETLAADYRTALIEGTMALYEIEHLCRWVPTMRPRLVDDFAWARCKALRVGNPRRPSIGISMDPSGERASVVMAWRQEDKSIALRELYHCEVDAEGLDELGEAAMKTARKVGADKVGYDDWTDRAFARHFKTKAKAIIGKDFANACDAFVKAVGSGQIKWTDCDHVTEDLRSTSRKDNDETGTFHAVRSTDDVPITAVLAAIRAYWLASGVPVSGSLRVQ